MIRWVRRWGVEVFVAIVAVGVRLLSLSSRYGLDAVVGYDDAAYFAGSQAFVAGHLPYRGFPFLQPPGVVLFATPFAVAGHWVGGDNAMVGLRLAVITMSAATCTLIASLLRRYGVAAALSGSLLYATHILSAAFGRSYFLEPFLSFAVVLTFWFLRRVQPRRLSYVLVGALMGVACTMKIWALVDISVLAVYVAVTRGHRLARAWLAGVAGAATVVCLPFFLADPHAMWQEVVVAQLGRVRSVSAASRLVMLDPFGPLPGWIHLGRRSSLTLVSVALLVASAPIVYELWRRRRPAAWDESAWWAILAGGEMATLLVAPSFFQHYFAWALASLSLAIGRAVGWIDHRWARVPLLTGILVVATCMAVVSYRGRVLANCSDYSAVRSFISAHDCTWIDSAAAEVFATDRDVPALTPCHPWPDPAGVAILFGGKTNSSLMVPDSHVARWQADVRTQLLASDSAVLCDGPDGTDFDAATIRLFEARFVHVDTSTRCTYWLRR
jgi:hypothetical protein